WRVRGWVEKCRKERGVEERRHAAVMRRLHRASHSTGTALTTLTTLQSERDSELGLIPCVVWLRKSQCTGADLQHLTLLPLPNTEDESNVGVVWWDRDLTCPPPATLLPRATLDHLQQRLAHAKLTQQLAARRHREGRAERRALTQEVEELKRELEALRHAYQVTKECKLGAGSESDLSAVAGQLATSLDLRWPSKVSSQVTRHNTTMTRLQGELRSEKKELRALQREETALAAHVLALRQEKDHLTYHLNHTHHPQVGVGVGVGMGVGMRGMGSGERGVGGSEEVRRLRATVTRQDHIISSLRREINALRNKGGSVVLPGTSPLAHPSPSSPSLAATAGSAWEEPHQQESSRDHREGDDSHSTTDTETNSSVSGDADSETGSSTT
ncbi:hypothetical protein Pcinc_012044, partial [Petrolisthes cinctipes]